MEGKANTGRGPRMNRADFSMPRTPAAQEAAPAEAVMRTSFDMPAALHRELRMLAAGRGVRLNALLAEAVGDVLAKYGRR